MKKAANATENAVALGFGPTGTATSPTHATVTAISVATATASPHMIVISVTATAVYAVELFQLQRLLSQSGPPIELRPQLKLSPHCDCHFGNCFSRPCEFSRNRNDHNCDCCHN